MKKRCTESGVDELPPSTRWYVLDDLDGYPTGLHKCVHAGFTLASRFQCKDHYIGEDNISPNARGLFEYLLNHGHRIVYSTIERDVTYDNRVYAHALIEVKL